MSHMLEAGCAYDTPPPPTPFTSRYVDSPCPSDAVECFQPTPRWTDLDPWAGVTHQQKQLQQQPQAQPQLQPQLQRSEHGNLVRWYPGGTTATAPFQTPREDSSGQERPARVELHLRHPVATPADLSRASNGSSAPGFGGQSGEISAVTSPLGSSAVDAKVQRIHGHVHRAATRSWSPPTSRTPAATPPPRWVQPRLSVTPHKAVFTPVSTTARQKPMGKRLSVCATVPFYTKHPGPPAQRAWQPNNLQACRWQLVETWPLLPTTTAEVQQRPMLPRQVSGNAVIFGQGMGFRRATFGQHALGQPQVQLHMPSSGARMTTPGRGMTNKADFSTTSALLGDPGATQPMETSCDELVQKHVATLCTPALSTRKEPSCCSPSLRP